MLLIRTDANTETSMGAGHVMRCAAIAHEAVAAGHEVLFLVSNEESQRVVQRQGYRAELVGGDPQLFMRVDAMNIARWARDCGARAVLIDSYAVTNDLFEGLRAALSGTGAKVAYVDDAFTFKEGFSANPAPIAADVVINYGFAFSGADYAGVYDGTDTRCCVGPAYTPVREPFVHAGFAVRPSVRQVLVTCGCADVGGVQERLARCCLEACPQARVNVVMGGKADFILAGEKRVEILRNVVDMASLMGQADIAVSAAGLTLYELAAAGVPTVAVPTAANQEGHVRGFYGRELGPVVPTDPIDFDAVTAAVAALAADEPARRAYSRRMRATVDGNGAARILNAIL